MSNTISLRFVPQRIVNVRPPPNAGFDICGSLSNSGAGQLALLGMSLGVRTTDLIWVQPEAGCPASAIRQVQLPPGAATDVYLPITFTREVLDAIELRRQGASEITLTFTLHAMAALLYTQQIGRETVSTLGNALSLAVDVRSADTGENKFRIARDTWLGFLQVFKYTDVEVFELPQLTLKQTLPPEAMAALRAAEQAFRQGDWRGTLEKTRFAFEAVSKLFAQDSDAKLAFAKLWQKLMPLSDEEPKRDALDKLVAGLRPFQHLGRHANHPMVDIDRHDALLALRMALSLFAFMGARAERSKAGDVPP